MWRMTHLSLLAAGAALGGGCASAPPARETAVPGEGVAALLATSDQEELHLVDGRLYLVPAGRPGERHEVGSWDDFASWYVRHGGAAVPESQPEEGFDVNGWVGLDCVRKGHACGREPERGTQPLMRVRIRFPPRP